MVLTFSWYDFHHDVHLVLPQNIYNLRQIENTFFKVHATQLSRTSIVFEGMLSVGGPPLDDARPLLQGDMEGSSDDHPIVIPELSANMFELYLSVAYNR
jgi:hypothetical protein